LDKTIITAFLIIAGVVSVVVLFNAIYPAIVQSSDAMLIMERRIDDRMKSQVEIVHAATDGGSNALIWVKNVGSTSLRAVERCDIFFGKEGNFVRIPHEGQGTGTPYWNYTVVNETDGVWKPTATLEITITNGAVLTAGRYYIKFATYNGLSNEYYFSIG
jgi:archaellum component FlaF (FlaF/FlaG flagellin family)